MTDRLRDSVHPCNEYPIGVRCPQILAAKKNPICIEERRRQCLSLKEISSF
jgi:hypothetical protein